MIDDTGGKDTLDVAEVNIRELDFLCNEVNVPDFKTVVVDAEELLISVVIKFDLVCSACSDWVAANGFSSFNVPDD